KNDREHHSEALAASDRDRDNPPSAAEARTARTADLNGDGYVTLNEVVALRKADLSDSEMIRRLEDTGQVFYLSGEQENYLRDRARHIGAKADQVVRVDPLEYRLRSYDNRLVLSIFNPTQDPITLAGDRSYVVDPKDQSHPLRSQTIAPNTFVRLILPPMRPG